MAMRDMFAHDHGDGVPCVGPCRMPNGFVTVRYVQADEIKAARAVVEQARAALKIAKGCHCDKGYPGGCGCGNAIDTATDLEEAIAAYDLATGKATGESGDE